MTDTKSYKTANGFYVGDKVETPKRERSFIHAIMIDKIDYAIPNDIDGTTPLITMVTLVALTNGDLWLDVQLTRVE